jgi:uncharacterized protein YdeI (YjbR/CyaY-like superfamily)
MIDRIEDYFALGCGRCPRFATAECSTRRWAGGLAALRRICLEAGLQETVKWGHPTYMHAGRNIAVMGAFRGDFRLSLFNAALLSDPDGALERQGPNTRVPDCLRFTAADAVDGRAPVIRAVLAEAMAHAEAGRRAPRDESGVDLPDELVDALDADPVLAEAFHALTPGRQKSHALMIGAAKTSATRAARVEKLRAKIFAGKGANER